MRKHPFFRTCSVLCVASSREKKAKVPRAFVDTGVCIEGRKPISNASMDAPLSAMSQRVSTQRSHLRAFADRSVRPARQQTDFSRRWTFAQVPKLQRDGGLPTPPAFLQARSRLRRSSEPGYRNACGATLADFLPRYSPVKSDCAVPPAENPTFLAVWSRRIARCIVGFGRCATPIMVATD